MKYHFPFHPGLNLGHADGHENKQRTEVLIFGFWVFVMSDIVLFGLLLATYLTTQNPMAMAGGPTPKDLFHIHSVFVQTVLLLTSTLTYGLGLLALRHKRPTGEVIKWLLVTMALGFGFLVFEALDFMDMIDKGAVPQRSGFLSAFWALVPMHGLHLTAGLIWMGVLVVQLKMYGTPDVIKTRALRLGIFWHFLGIVWIGIFTMVFLAGLAP